MRKVKLLAVALLASCTALSAYSKQKQPKMKNNPLMIEWKTPHQTPPFEKIKPEHFMPAIEAQIAQANQQIDMIVNARSMPTFENTIEALEFSSEDLGRTLGVFYNLLNAETSDEIQAISLQISPIITEFGNDILLNEKLFDRVKFVYEKRNDIGLNTEQMAILEKHYQNFNRGGANLSDADKDKYRKISGELAELSIKFDQNILTATNAYTLYITDEAKLSGLPESVRSMAALEAKNKGKEGGWLFTLQMPSYLPFMTYADNRELRKELWMAYNGRCMAGDSIDNKELVRRISELRIELANLLGHKTFADYVLEERMAEKTEKVYELMNTLLDKSVPQAQADKQMIQEYAQSKGLQGDIQSWDWSYYTDKYKTEKYNISEEMTRPYFKLENVEKAMFLLANKLYGINFVENKKISTYHKDVKAYEVFDNNGEFLAVFYTDFFPRASKRGGAWMNQFRSTQVHNGVETRPIVTIVCNFTKPTEDTPSLLTFNEVETSLHEFGHALHGILAKGSYPSITGPEVYRDFVELPSQILENWADQKEFLDLWAVHYQTGEKMPEEMIQKIIDSRQYLAAYNNIRQLYYGLNDMAWHTITEPVKGSIEDFERNATAKTQILPYVEGTAMSPTFSHVFSGGYAAGYYSYKWAEVLEADAFAKFIENGIFDKETAESFRRNILEKGGSEHPMDLYVKFAGHEPSPEALLKKMGINE